jgi:hypothetical protein
MAAKFMGGLPHHSLSALLPGRPCPGEAQTPKSAGRVHPARCTVSSPPADLLDCQSQAAYWRAGAIGRGGAVAEAADVHLVGSTFGGRRCAVALEAIGIQRLATETVARPR